MSPRPTPPSDADPEQPVEPSAEAVQPDPVPPAADDTAVLPQPAAATPAATGSAGSPTPSGGAGGPAGYPEWAQPAPGAPVATASSTAGPPRAPQRWWGEATSTSGGRVALAVAGLVTVVVLLAGAALVGGLVLRAVGGDHHDRMAFSDDRGPFSDRPGRGDGAPGQQRGRGMMPDGPQGRVVPPAAPDQGRGGSGMGRGMGGLGLGGLGGDVLHGEFTATVDGTPTVMVVQTGEVRTYTSGRTLVVRSSDGFEATYVLDGSVAATRGATGLATGAEVRVVAKKEGMAVTRLVVVT
ncbi:hypothetical protein [Oryzobacter terrae]|uniref:hypothetical protein n=1 Tax=Oryzobacter terrae TaxID=1620385 RepID=UPI00366AD053